MNSLVILGATGSIGRQTLEVAERLDITVSAVSSLSASENLRKIAAAHPMAKVVVAGAAPSEQRDLVRDLGSRVSFGAESLVEVASTAGTTVVNGIVGVAGLAASVAALESGNRLALANKESLVAGGPVVLAALKRGGGELIPVDSEHSALFQCLMGEALPAVRRLILTASGGPFRGSSADDLAAVTVEQALDHPTWAMGPRITVDSASLMNKAFEVIEAHFLFGFGYDQIDVVVHPQSIIHSLVEFVDGSLKAHLGEPDMRVPIQFAVTEPARAAGDLAEFDLVGRALTFEAPDPKVFRCLALGYEAGRTGGSAPAVLNAADEVAVRAFLERRIGFSSIPEIVERTLEATPISEPTTVGDVMAVDSEAREHAMSLIGGQC